MSVTAVVMESCSRCAALIDVCAFCNEPGCGAAICYGCLNVALGQAMANPHSHGG
jgi:hypothetical protein